MIRNNGPPSSPSSVLDGAGVTVLLVSGWRIKAQTLSWMIPPLPASAAMILSHSWFGTILPYNPHTKIKYSVQNFTQTQDTGWALCPCLSTCKMHTFGTTLLVFTSFIFLWVRHSFSKISGKLQNSAVKTSDEDWHGTRRKLSLQEHGWDPSWLCQEQLLTVFYPCKNASTTCGNSGQKWLFLMNLWDCLHTSKRTPCIVERTVE